MVEPKNTTYESKLDQVLQQGMREWWNSLSKEELLTYIMEQPQITADFIRQMLSNENCLMGFGVKFHMATNEVKANLHVNRH